MTGLFILLTLIVDWHLPAYCHKMKWLLLKGSYCRVRSLGNLRIRNKRIESTSQWAALKLTLSSLKGLLHKLCILHQFPLNRKLNSQRQDSIV